MLDTRRTFSVLMAGILFAGLAACGTAETGPGPILDTGPPGSEISAEVEASLRPEITVGFDITGTVAIARLQVLLQIEVAPALACSRCAAP